ncbi:MAG TPA: DUF488 family protein [Nitrospira sp.]|nr:DUF488 family protein [Nitrospira sp.]
MIQTKRIYSEATSRDGVRILVDRIWPRGISKERARIVAWRRELAPTTALRKWYGHDPAKWVEFRRRYQKELRRSLQLKVRHELARQTRSERVTLLYSAADDEHNQAVVLKDLLEKQARRRHKISHRSTSRKARRERISPK